MATPFLAVMLAQSILDIPAPQPGIRINYGDSPQQFGELRLPAAPGPFPVVVVIHGGFWKAAYSLDHIGHMAKALTDRGVATWSLEYRRLGDEGGGYPGTFEDVITGINHLRAMAESHRLDLTRTAVTGHSAGGQLALYAARRISFLRAAIALAPVADLARAHELGLSQGITAQLLGGSPTEQPARYRATSPIEMLPLRKPASLIHGVKDTIVPLALSERYVEAAAAQGDHPGFIAIRDTGHFELIDPRWPNWKTVAETILNHLK